MRNYLNIVLLICLIYFSSLGVIDKFFGIPGLIFYFCFIITLFYFLFASPYLKSFILQPKLIYIVLIFSLAVLFVMFFIIYPIANNPQNFIGSDSDDALNIAVNKLLKFQYPYYTKTYLGNAITPMPGALILAMPFVLLGTSAYQNFFWIILYLLFLYVHIPSKQSALYLFFIIFMFTPLIPYHIFTGSDYIANSLYVLLSIYLFYYYLNKKGVGILSYLSAFLTGITLSSRPNFLLLLPVIFVFLLKKYNLKTSVAPTIFMIFGFLLITLPFYLYDSSGFSPLNNVDKLKKFNDIIPYAEIIIPFLSVILAIVYGILSKKGKEIDCLMICCFIVMFIPVFSGFVLSSIQSTSFNFRYTFYSTYYIFFFAPISWEHLFSFKKVKNPDLF